MADLEPGELEPGEIRPSADKGQAEQPERADAKSFSPNKADLHEEHRAGSPNGEKGELEPLYSVEWSRLGPLRLPPMPRTATLSRHFGVMPPDFHFTSIGL